MDRRDFLKTSFLLAGAAALPSCSGDGKTGQTAGMMTCRKDKKTGADVGILGFGTMRLPTVNSTSGREDKDAPLDQEMVNRLIDRAIEGGVTYFDTAPVYCKGNSEKAVGTALSRHNRDEFTIATKLSNFSHDTWSREESMKIYEDSFKNLQVDYIDYYLLHFIGQGKDGMENFRKRFVDNGMLDFLLKEREAGRIRHLGFSYHGDIRVFDMLLDKNDLYNWDFALIQMNYVDWSYAKQMNPRNTNASYLYGRLEALDIPVVIMEPLLGGKLVNPSARIVDEMLEREPSLSPAAWSFRFCGHFPRVLTILSGMTYMEHVEDNLHTCSPLKDLTAEELEFLHRAATDIASYPSVPCNDCGYCVPCPYGIDIPGIFSHYNKCVSEGKVCSDLADPQWKKMRRQYLATYAKTVEPARAADKCIGCGQCLESCPQRIDIPKELRKIDSYVEKLRRGGVK